MPARAVAGIGRSTGKRGTEAPLSKAELAGLDAKMAEFDKKRTGHANQRAVQASGQQWINLYLKLVKAAESGKGIDNLTPSEVEMLKQISTNATAGRRISTAHAFLISFFESEEWRSHRTYSEAEAWLDLYGMGLGDPGGITITKGRELATSIRILAVRWGWDKMTVRRYLIRLHDAGRIETTFEQRRTVICICAPSASSVAQDTTIETTGNLNSRTARPAGESL
jgi:hypothetical protein